MKKREREKRMVSEMIALYCRRRHGTRGGGLSPECAELAKYARSRSDRRVVQVTLTPRGRAVYEYHRAFHERMISSILDTLSPEQSTVLAQSLEKLQDFFLREEAAAEGENNG